MVNLILPEAVRLEHERKLRARAKAEKADVRRAKGRNTYVIPPAPAVSPKNAPNQPTTPPSAAPTPRTGKTAPTTPLPPVERVEHSELTTWETFKAAHMELANRIDDYLRPGRRNRPALDRATRADMEHRAALFLPYNNPFARVRYARLMGEGLERLALTRPPGTPMFFVTLIHHEHAVPLKNAADFKLARVTGWVHQLLRGANYVGMVEGAYYSNLDVLGPYRPKGISYHAHAILWGLSEAELAAICDEANSHFAPLVAGRSAAHYRPLRLEEVFGQGLYMSKGQVREYRNWHRRKTVTNPDTGEITTPTTGRFGGGKRPLRLCDAVHLCNVFAKRYVDDFAFAAGDGRAVLQAIKREALAEFHRWEARQPYKLAEERRRSEFKFSSVISV